jgi:hypothetical protein
MTTLIPYKLSGHETFTCRYAWLPKAVKAVSADPLLFSNEDQAMVVLGVGKNMVRSIKFWAEAAQVIEPTTRGESAVTQFGSDILGPEGFDPFLENSKTLWLLHWKIATNAKTPLFHWVLLLNQWHRSEFTQTEALAFFKRELRTTKPASERTLIDGFRVFINTYVSAYSKTAQVAEDTLDCPLAELGLVKIIGQRSSSNGHISEPIYSFSVQDKSEITRELHAYCLADYWHQQFPGEQTVPAHKFISGPASPGQIFKLPEPAMRHRLEDILKSSAGNFRFEESASVPQVVRNAVPILPQMLERVYGVAQ